MIPNAYRRLAALDEIRMYQEEEKLSVVLSAMGLELNDARAIAHNTAFLWLSARWEEQPSSPMALLFTMNLEEIAVKCTEAKAAIKGSWEFGINHNHGEVPHEY